MPDRPDPSTAALHAALLDYSRSPGKYQVALRQPRLLFSQLREVLQIAVGREGEKAAAETSPGLRDSARFFVRTALLYPGADHYGVLGLDRQAEGADLKDRYRLLMRLLHPDFAERGGRAWPADAAVRVNLAYDTLSSAVRRREYDERSSPASAAGPGPSPVPKRSWPVVAADAGEKRQSNFKMLAVACALAGAALVLVSLFATGTADTGHLVQRTLVLPVPLPTATREPMQTQNREPVQTVKREPPETPRSEPVQIAMQEPAPPFAPVPGAVIPGGKVVIPGLSRDPPPRQPPARLQTAAPAKLPEPGMVLADPALPQAGPAERVNLVARAPEVSPRPAPAEVTRQEPRPTPVVAVPPPPAPAAPPAPVIATAAPAVAIAPPASARPAMKPGPTLIEAQPLLSQLLQRMESGRGDRILNLLDAETRANPSAQALSRQYDTLVDGARPVRVSHVEFRSEPGDGRLLVIGYLRLLAGEQAIGAVGKKMVLRAEFASREGTVVMTGLSGGAVN